MKNGKAKSTRRYTGLVALACCCLLLAGCATSSTRQAELGQLQLTLRSLKERKSGSQQWRVVEERVSWSATNTAVVICDMWDQHWCKGATERVAEIAPRMNLLVNTLRERGVLVIHCPSETMAFYKDYPGRKLAQSAPKVALTLAKRTEPAQPLDSSDGGCDCQPQCNSRPPYPWSREIATLEIKEGDAITDSAEAFYLMRQRGITNVMVMGVHENMCVLNRAFAIKQMVRLGQNVVLIRDMTDTMYNSRRAPYVDHFTGNDLMTWYIEQYWCATASSEQILGGKPFRFAADAKPPRVFGQN